MKKLKTILGLLAFLVAQTFLYWMLQPGFVFPLTPVRSVEQYTGSVSVLDIPLEVSNLDKAMIKNKIIDLKGKIVAESDFAEWSRGDQYKILTDSRLLPGEYNVIVSVQYRVNPVQSRKAEFIIAVLNVRVNNGDN